MTASSTPQSKILLMKVLFLLWILMVLTFVSKYRVSNNELAIWPVLLNGLILIKFVVFEKEVLKFWVCIDRASWMLHKILRIKILIHYKVMPAKFTSNIPENNCISNKSSCSLENKPYSCLRYWVRITHVWKF